MIVIVNMKDAVSIGKGYVGKATMKTFGIEKFYTRSEKNITLDEIKKTKYIFICLPTPTISGRCFTDDIYEFIDKVKNPDSIFIIRSTVEVGFAETLKRELKVKVVSNPEFLSEATWEQDAVKPKMIVLGGDGPSLEAIKGLYQGRFKYSKPLVADNTTAEMIKYAFNSWFSTKVIFSNEMFDICQNFKANYETVKRALETHPWGMTNHNVIFYNGKRGLGGHCLPKDIEAFADQTDNDFFKLISERQYEQEVTNG